MVTINSGRLNTPSAVVSLYSGSLSVYPITDPKNGGLRLVWAGRKPDETLSMILPDYVFVRQFWTALILGQPPKPIYKPSPYCLVISERLPDKLWRVWFLLRFWRKSVRYSVSLRQADLVNALNAVGHSDIAETLIPIQPRLAEVVQDAVSVQ